MPDAATSFDVREASETARVIAIEGDITAQSEEVLMDAYGRASGDGVRSIVLDFTGLQYMNSGGIGLLVTLLALGVFGYVKGRFTVKRPIRSTWQTIAVGGLAAAAAFVLAKLIA